MLTQKTRYAILALTRLAKERESAPLSINYIAEKELIPKRFLELILFELKKNGYLDSKLGKYGGYCLIKDPDEITLLEIVRMFEGSISWLACTSVDNYQECEHCREEKLCKIRDTFSDIRSYTYEKLSKTSLAAIADL
jgi:Rrf2 family protein